MNSIPYWLRPSIQSFCGGLLNAAELNPTAIEYEKTFIAVSLTTRITRVLHSSLLICVAFTLDLGLWTAQTLLIYRAIKIGLKNHLANLISTIAFPILCLGIPFEHIPRPNYFRRCLPDPLYDNTVRLIQDVSAPLNAMTQFLDSGGRPQDLHADALRSLNNFPRARFFSEAPLAMGRDFGNINRPDKYGRTALMYATDSRWEVFSLFFNIKRADARLALQPIDVNARDLSGTDALTYVLLGISPSETQEKAAYSVHRNLFTEHYKLPRSYRREWSQHNALWIIQKLIEEGAIVRSLQFKELANLTRQLRDICHIRDEGTLRGEFVNLQKQYTDTSNHYIRFILRRVFKPDNMNQFFRTDEMRRILRKFTQLLHENAQTLCAQKSRIVELWKPHYEKRFAAFKTNYLLHTKTEILEGIDKLLWSCHEEMADPTLQEREPS